MTNEPQYHEMPGSVSVTIFDEDDQPSRIVSAEQDFTLQALVRLDLKSLPRVDIRKIKASFFLEAIGSGPESQYEQELPWDWRKDRYLFRVRVDRQYAPPGAYKLVAVVLFTGADGKVLPMSGFDEAPLLQVY